MVAGEPLAGLATFTVGRLAARLSRGLAGFLLVALAGCVSLPQSDALREAPPQGLPSRVELKDVPFHLQDDFLCGPATLAMVFNAAGVPATVETLTPMVYLPGRQGSLQAEMLGATRRNGLVAYAPPQTLEGLLREVAAGTPAIVLLNLSLRWMPIWHYAVVIGYDLGERKVIVRSGKRSREEWSFAFLEFFWQESGYWSMLALPPGRLPAAADEAGFTAAVAALEKAGRRDEAATAYRASLERWPTSLVALIGLGNVAYGRADLAGAEQAFRRATQAHPQSGAAWNNLAHVLGELQRWAEAEAAARKAVAVGGPTRDAAERTLAEILARQR